MLGRVVAAPEPEYRGINVSWLIGVACKQKFFSVSFEANEIGDACTQAITGTYYLLSDTLLYL